MKVDLKMKMVFDHFRIVLMKNFANSMKLMMSGEYERDALACFCRG